MTSYKDLLKIVPTIQSTDLVVDNLNFIKKKDRKIKGFASKGIKNIVGVSLISETAKFTNSF